MVAAMPLFKYVPMGRVDILVRQRVRYTQPGAFNDPFEMPAFLERAMEVASFRQKVANQLPIKMRATYERLPLEQKAKMPFKTFATLAETQFPQLLAGAAEFISLVTPILRQKIRELDQMVGILSLTETPDNLLMWSHYADQHRGIVLEFDEHHPILNRRKSSNDEFGHLRKVVYSDIRPIVTL